MPAVVLSCDIAAVAYVSATATAGGALVPAHYPVCISPGDGVIGWHQQGVFSVSLDDVNALLPGVLVLMAIAWVFTLIRQKIMRS